MDNDNLTDYLLSSRFKDSRRKKRVVKSDFNKQLIQIRKREQIIWDAIRDLPLVPLEKPYQQGWVRFFVVRDDVMRSKDGEFFRELLEKINTYMYSNTKSFVSRRKQKRSQIQHLREQFLYAIPLSQWNSNELKLSDKEKSHFTLTEKWSNCFKRYVISYKFNEPWRYVLRIRPYWVTHQKALNTELESESARLENYIINNDLRHKMTKIKHGSANYKYKEEIIRIKYANSIKNKNVNALYQMYLDEKI